MADSNPLPVDAIHHAHKARRALAEDRLHQWQSLHGRALHYIKHDHSGYLVAFCLQDRCRCKDRACAHRMAEELPSVEAHWRKRDETDQECRRLSRIWEGMSYDTQQVLPQPLSTQVGLLLVGIRASLAMIPTVEGHYAQLASTHFHHFLRERSKGETAGACSMVAYEVRLFPFPTFSLVGGYGCGR